MWPNWDQRRDSSLSRLVAGSQWARAGRLRTCAELAKEFPGATLRVGAADCLARGLDQISLGAGNLRATFQRDTWRGRKVCFFFKTRARTLFALARALSRRPAQRESKSRWAAARGRQISMSAPKLTPISLESGLSN